QGSPVKFPHKLLCFQHIDDHMRVCIVHNMDRVIYLVGGNHGIEKVHLFLAVSADCLHTGNPMAAMPDIGLYHLQPLVRSGLNGHQIITMMEGGDHARGDELEDDRIPRELPSKDHAVQTVHQCISHTHNAP